MGWGQASQVTLLPRTHPTGLAAGSCEREGSPVRQNYSHGGMSALSNGGCHWPHTTLGLQPRN